MNRFLSMAISAMPSLLSLQDRTQFSPTYGCFDREHWQYRKTDVPYASVQGAVYALSILYKKKFASNVYYGNKRIKEWIIAGLLFLEKIQKKDGSFDEYYPNEHSYIGTSLTIYPCSESFNLLFDEIEPEQRARIGKVLRKAADYLSKNHEPKVINQEAMACLAIACVNEKFPCYKDVLNKKLSLILRAQNHEGWFPEYEGCDVGYLSYTIDFLSELYAKKGNSQIPNAIDRAVEFISYFLHPNGSAGGEYTARDTEYLVPSGFAARSTHLSLAILKFIEESRDLVGLDCLDNRYLPLYVHQYLKAGMLKGKKAVAKLPFQMESFEKYFPGAGIYVRKGANYYLIVGTKKGGVYRYYSGEKVISDCGYLVNGKKVLCSSYFDDTRSISVEKDSITVNGLFYRIKPITPSVFNHIILRLISIGLFSKVLREMLKYVLITKKRLVKISFCRVFYFKAGIKVEDSITSENEIRLYRVGKFSFRYIPSAKFFTAQELKMPDAKFIGANRSFRISTT